MGQVVADGTIQAGPASSGDGVFPSSTFDGQIRLRTSPKQYLACTGSTGRAFNSPSSYVALPSIGTGGDVTKVDTLYIRSSSEVSLQLTTDDGAGGDVVAIIPLDGGILLEFPTTKYLKLLELKGSATIEYFASGQA